MVEMAYHYEDLDKRGLLDDEEESSSSNKRKFEADSPETIREPEKRKRSCKKPEASNTEADKSREDKRVKTRCHNCKGFGHWSKDCKAPRKPKGKGTQSSQK